MVRFMFGRVLLVVLFDFIVEDVGEFSFLLDRLFFVMVKLLLMGTELTVVFLLVVFCDLRVSE